MTKKKTPKNEVAASFASCPCVCHAICTCKCKPKLKSFVKHCNKHPDQKFWQALRNWSGFDRIFLADEATELLGTFYIVDDE